MVDESDKTSALACFTAAFVFFGLQAHALEEINRPGNRHRVGVSWQ